MHIGIYSLRKVLYEGEAQSLTCKTLSGEITVLDGHRPLISVLKKGVIKLVQKNGKEEYVPAAGGFLEVRPKSKVRMIVEEES